MGCIAEVMASVSDVNFKCKKEAQKYLIEFVLIHSQYDLKALAEILDVSTLLLGQVLCGKVYLDENIARKLVEWFLLFVSD